MENASASFRCLSSARVYEAWTTGPSAMGSEKGKPISKKSAASAATGRRSRVKARWDHGGHEWHEGGAWRRGDRGREYQSGSCRRLYPPPGPLSGTISPRTISPENARATLHGQVAIVTGASRGIGRAIALGLAKAGCDVVVAAKSTESTEKLPGSIYTVAAEVEALGRRRCRCRWTCATPTRSRRMAAQTLERFGRIDLLVNNAGALHWAGILDTPAKRFDLVMGVNARAAFLCCRAVLPAMIRQGGGHIINMSPPLDLSILPGRIAYGISKLGMTLLTLGLAEEVRRHNVAVNSLWPVTIIEIQAQHQPRAGHAGDVAEAGHPGRLRAAPGPQGAGRADGPGAAGRGLPARRGGDGLQRLRLRAGMEPPRLSWGAR